MLAFYERAVVVTVNEVFYLGIKEVLESRTIIQDVEHARNVKQVEALNYSPQLIIFDWDAYDQALKAIRKLTELKLNVIVFSQENYPFIGSLCSKYDALGYLNKNTDASSIARILNERILKGKKHFDSVLKKPPLLSKNEYIVAKYLCDGLDHNAIAQKMSISRKTVSTYKVRIFTKLGIKSIMSLCDYIKQS